MTEVALPCDRDRALARHGSVISGSHCASSHGARRMIRGVGRCGMAHMTKQSDNPGEDVSDETTRKILARIYDNPAERGDLLAYAASFFRNSTRRTVLGVDAHWLLGEAVDKVMKKGFPDAIDSPVAYLKNTIKNTWIDKHRQHQSLDRRRHKIDEEYGQTDEPNLVEELIGALSEPAEAEAIAQQFETFLSRHRPPIPEIGRARRDHPELPVSEIATLVGTSERSVYRAMSALKKDADMRALLDQINDDTTLDRQEHS